MARVYPVPSTPFGDPRPVTPLRRRQVTPRSPFYWYLLRRNPALFRLLTARGIIEQTRKYGGRAGYRTSPAPVGLTHIHEREAIAFTWMRVKSYRRWKGEDEP